MFLLSIVIIVKINAKVKVILSDLPVLNTFDKAGHFCIVGKMNRSDGLVTNKFVILA